MRVTTRNLVALMLAAMCLPAFTLAEDGAGSFRGPLVYKVEASEPRRNHRVMGPVTRYVQGVPAEPVDSFVWNGVGSEPIVGQLQLEIDPVNDVGLVIASWTDSYGDWTYTQTRFIHPEHSSGARFGSSVEQIHDVINEGVAHNVYLHGDSGAGMPVVPLLFNHLAAWGPADVTLNGEPFINTFEIPKPQWIGHLMVTEGVRHPDGTIRTIDGSIYNPTLGKVGATEEGDLEVHLVFHDERFPRTTNIPPLFSFFYHLVFEDVKISIAQEEIGARFGPGRGTPATENGNR